MSKFERWQKALNNWDDWRNSISETKNIYGAIDKLLSRGKPVLRIEENSGSIHIKISKNKTTDILSGIYDEIVESGNKFIFDKIGLRPKAYLHQELLSYWIDSINSEIRQYFDLLCFLQLMMVKAEQKDILHDSKFVTKNGKEVIIDSISWQRGKISRKEVARQLLEITWPTRSEVNNKSQGGRPSLDCKCDCEALVCGILYHLQGMKLSEIDSVFGWKPQKTDYVDKLRNVGKNSKILIYKDVPSRTVYKRMETLWKMLGMK